jgi:hypothetical protein
LVQHHFVGVAIAPTLEGIRGASVKANAPLAFACDKFDGGWGMGLPFRSARGRMALAGDAGVAPRLDRILPLRPLPLARSLPRKANLARQVPPPSVNAFGSQRLNQTAFGLCKLTR